MSRKSLRSPLARARGLGSAKEGVESWWQERLTAVALVPLALWFIASMIVHGGDDYIEVTTWLRTPFSTLMMVLLVAAIFHHSALGLQVIIEDYVHSAAKISALVAVQIGCLALAATGILAALRVAISG